MRRIVTVLPVLAVTGSIFAVATSATAQSSTLTAGVMARAGERPPRVYFTPMAGQMGTDIHPSIYAEVVKDVRAKNPDLIVFLLEGSDPEEGVFHFHEDTFDPTDQSLATLGEYREIVKLLRDDLGDIPQVMWVQNSVGFSSLMALAWPDMYMKSDARLAGLGRVHDGVMGWTDIEVRRKMLSAWLGIVNGFLEKGGYARAIGDAMVRPDKFLSVSFEGRNVTWSLDTDGHWVIDGNEKGTAAFSAMLAEDVGLAKGVADTREDLMFLLGFREFEAITNSEQLVERFVQDWRRSWEQSQRWAMDYRDAMRWASGEDELRYLGQAINALEKIQSAMRRYEPVAIKWRITTGLDETQLEIWIEQIRERIRGIRQRDRGGRGGGGGGGLGGPAGPRR